VNSIVFPVSFSLINIYLLIYTLIMGKTPRMGLWAGPATYRYKNPFQYWLSVFIFAIFSIAPLISLMKIYWQ
jgi:hypothetical protein